MNRKQIRSELLKNMDKIIDMIKYEKRIRKNENIWITKVRINLENELIYFQYEGATRVGFLIYCLNHRTDIDKLFMYDNDQQAEAEINLIKNHRDKNIIEFRFRKEKEN